MQILILIDEDGSEESFAERDPLRSLAAHLKQHDVETIVVGEVDGDGNVIWEKQFSAVTVMPSSLASQAEAETGLGQVPVRRWEAEPVELAKGARDVSSQRMDQSTCR